MREAIRVRSDLHDVHPNLVKIVAFGSLGAVALAVFGLPPISVHGPLHFLGVMDPLCGMTRAVRFMARGDVADAWRYNPASFVLAAAALVVALRWVRGRMTGRWWTIEIISRARVYAILAVPAAALWMNQQLNVSLLR